MYKPSSDGHTVQEMRKRACDIYQSLEGAHPNDHAVIRLSSVLVGCASEICERLEYIAYRLEQIEST